MHNISCNRQIVCLGSLWFVKQLSHVVKLQPCDVIAESPEQVRKPKRFIQGINLPLKPEAGWIEPSPGFDDSINQIVSVIKQNVPVTKVTRKKN